MAKISPIQQRLNINALSKNKSPVGSKKKDKKETTEMNNTDFLSTCNESWDDLTGLSKGLGEATMTMVHQVYQMTENQELLGCFTPEETAQFNKLCRTFFSDAEGYSKNVERLNSEFAGKSGKFDSMEDYTLYTRLSVEFQTLHENLNILVAPILTELMMLSHGAVARAADERSKEDLTNPAVISDIEVK